MVRRWCALPRRPRHWSDFAAARRDKTDGVGLPALVVDEFRTCLRCGMLAHGLARVRCADCALERLAPFSTWNRSLRRRVPPRL
jgi:hypothetical protein